MVTFHVDTSGRKGGTWEGIQGKVTIRWRGLGGAVWSGSPYGKL